MRNPESENQGTAPSVFRASAATADSAGLVGLATRGTWNPHCEEIRRKSRLSRMRRAVLNAGDEIQSEVGSRSRTVMLTLTYRWTWSWQPRHINDLINHCRKWLARRGHPLRYVWVAELQTRGAVHYHVVIWLPRGLTLPKPDKHGWWPHGSTRIEWARKPCGYLTKYATKGTDVEFPKGLRLHGRGGLDEQQRKRVSWWLLPRYVREYFTEVGTRVIRAYKGGWVEISTGEWIPAWGAT